jgi:hypothetical protein
MPTRRKIIGEPRRTASAQDPPAVPTEQRIARRAYELFVERGCAHGRDRDDWLSAERELLAATPSAARGASPDRAAARVARPDIKVASRPRRGSLLRMPSTTARNKTGKPSSA